jgi:hypothetical protein
MITNVCAGASKERREREKVKDRDWADSKFLFFVSLL